MLSDIDFLVGDKVKASTQDQDNPDMTGIVVRVTDKEVIVNFGEDGKKYYGSEVLAYDKVFAPFCLEKCL